MRVQIPAYTDQWMWETDTAKSSRLFASVLQHSARLARKWRTSSWISPAKCAHSCSTIARRLCSHAQCRTKRGAPLRRYKPSRIASASRT